MKGRHVLIIVENLPVPPDYRVWQIARTLRDAGVRVSIICPASSSCPVGHYDIEGIQVYRHSLPREPRTLWHYCIEYVVALWHELRLSIRIFRRDRFHVVHICNPPDVLWCIALIWRIWGVRCVYDHHDLCPELFVTKCGVNDVAELSFMQRCVYRLLRGMEKVSQRCAHTVLVTNETFARRAEQNNKISPGCITIVRTGPRATEVPSTPPAYTPVDPPRIGYVGVMAAQDGVDGLLRSSAHLIHTLGYTCQLYLMGDGPERTQLEKLASQLKLDDHVHFAGFVPRAEVFASLSQCVCGVTPDPPGLMNNASTMLKVLEYMACARTQVLYDLPENRVSAGDTAIYARAGDEKDFAQCLSRLLDRPEECERLGRAAYERVQTLTWEKVGAKPLVQAYAQLWPDSIAETSA